MHRWTHLDDDAINIVQIHWLLTLMETGAKQHRAQEHTHRGHQANEQYLHYPTVKEH